MSGSTNVENNVCIVYMDIEPKEKENGKLTIETGKYGEKGQDGDYEIKLSKGKVLTTDTKARKRLEAYTKTLNKIAGKDKKLKGKNIKEIKEDER